nr:unnamed protein product [Callosobruchus chinensis]
MFLSYDEDSSCSGQGCLKRSTQEEGGPFWANRGKRYPLLENKPCWILVRQKDSELDELPIVYRHVY